LIQSAIKKQYKKSHFHKFSYKKRAFSYKYATKRAKISPAVANHRKNFAIFGLAGKELDEETGLYYYGARYLDPRTSRWLTGDPAIYQGDYIPVAPISDDARKHNQNLPGLGGIFNIVNMHAYHYAGNNPVKYLDPDGRRQTANQREFTAALANTSRLLNNSNNQQDLAEFRSMFSISIVRSVRDDGANGQYYQSTLNIVFGNRVLNSVDVQTTADHPNTPELGGRTLPSGEYKGILLSHTRSYIRPIHLVDGNNARRNNSFLIHTDRFTNRDNNGNNGPWSQPYSAGCIIMRDSDFNEMMDILGSVGFNVGDTIPVIIHQPPGNIIILPSPNNINE